jgi:hypothetical protein
MKRSRALIPWALFSLMLKLLDVQILGFYGTNARKGFLKKGTCMIKSKHRRIYENILYEAVYWLENSILQYTTILSLSYETMRIFSYFFVFFRIILWRFSKKFDKNTTNLTLFTILFSYIFVYFRIFSYIFVYFCIFTRILVRFFKKMIILDSFLCHF